MTRPQGLVLLLCVSALSACQSNSQARPGVVISPVANAETEQNNDQLSTPSSENAVPGLLTTPEYTSSEPQSKPNNLADNSLQVDFAQTTGNIQESELTEVSGLAASTRLSNTFWAVNDSGNRPKLFAFDHKGKSLGDWTINAENRDWEDMASAWINGESYLFIADIGDNVRVKKEHAIHIIAEPLLNDTINENLEPLHTIRFRYPAATHNAESMAIGGNWIYILTKEPLLNGQRQASHVYRIPLSLSQQNQVVVTAEFIAQLAIPASSFEANVIASLGGVDISQPTAFDIDRQNRTAYVLTYRQVYRYQREENQNWAQVLAQARQRIHTHSLSQAEALAVSDNGVVWFTSEKRPAPLWALPSIE